MKKLTSLLLALCLIAALYGCGEDRTYPESTVIPEGTNEDIEEIETVPSDHKLGIGIVTGTKGSSPADENNLGKIRTSTVICALSLDDEGIIRKVKFDEVTKDFPFDNKGSFTEDITLPFRTMREMGFDVGLRESSDTQNEWFQQMDIFESWITGKKAADVLNMELDDNFIPIVPDLEGKIDIGVSDFLTALNKAYLDAK